MFDIDLLVAFVIVFGAGIVSGLAAFGFALVAVPLLLFLYEPPAVVAIVLILAMVTRWIVLRHTWLDVRWDVVIRMVPAGLIGAVTGVLVLREVDSAIIELLAGTVVIVSALIMLSGRTIPGTRSRGATPIAGFASGALNSTVGMAGPPIVILFSAREYPTQVFRGTMTALFYIITGAALLILIQQGLVEQEETWISVALIPAAIGGTILGQRLLPFVSPAQFRRIVLIMLLVTGTIGVVAALNGID